MSYEKKEFIRSTLPAIGQLRHFHHNVFVRRHRSSETFQLVLALEVRLRDEAGDLIGAPLLVQADAARRRVLLIVRSRQPALIPEVARLEEVAGRRHGHAEGGAALADAAAPGG